MLLLKGSSEQHLKQKTKTQRDTSKNNKNLSKLHWSWLSHHHRQEYHQWKYCLVDRSEIKHNLLKIFFHINRHWYYGKLWTNHRVALSLITITPIKDLVRSSIYLIMKCNVSHQRNKEMLRWQTIFQFSNSHLILKST